MVSFATAMKPQAISSVLLLPLECALISFSSERKAARDASTSSA